MNPLTELDRQIHSMQLLQLLLLFVFMTAYVTAIGRVLGARGRRRAAGVAAAAAVGLGVAMQPWTVGVLMAVAGVASVGLFVMATVLVSRALGGVDAAVRLRAAVPAVAARVPGVQPAGTALRPGLFQRLWASAR